LAANRAAAAGSYRTTRRGREPSVHSRVVAPSTSTYMGESGRSLSKDVLHSGKHGLSRLDQAAVPATAHAVVPSFAFVQDAPRVVPHDGPRVGRRARRGSGCASINVRQAIFDSDILTLTRTPVRQDAPCRPRPRTAGLQRRIHCRCRTTRPGRGPRKSCWSDRRLRRIGRSRRRSCHRARLGACRHASSSRSCPGCRRRSTSRPRRAGPRPAMSRRSRERPMDPRSSTGYPRTRRNQAGTAGRRRSASRRSLRR